MGAGRGTAGRAGRASATGGIVGSRTLARPGGSPAGPGGGSRRLFTTPLPPPPDCGRRATEAPMTPCGDRAHASKKPSRGRSPLTLADASCEPGSGPGRSIFARPTRGRSPITVLVSKMKNRFGTVAKVSGDTEVPGLDLGASPFGARASNSHSAPLLPKSLPLLASVQSAPNSRRADNS